MKAVIVISKLIPEIDINITIILLICSLIAGGIATILTLYVGRKFSKLITKVNYKMLAISIIIFVSTLVTIMTSCIGLLVLVTSTAIGLIPGIECVL